MTEAPVETALTEMRQAADACGIVRGDPFDKFIEAASLVALAIETASSVHGQLAVEAATAARKAAEAQLSTIRAQVDQASAETTRAISSSIRADVVRELRAWTHRLDRGTAFKAALVLFAVGGACGGGGYVVGQDAGQRAAVAAAVGLQAELTAKPDETTAWLALTRRNNILFAIKRCVPVKESSGRACMVPLWLESPEIGEGK